MGRDQRGNRGLNGVPMFGERHPPLFPRSLFFDIRNVKSNNAAIKQQSQQGIRGKMGEWDRRIIKIAEIEAERCISEADRNFETPRINRFILPLSGKRNIALFTLPLSGKTKLPLRFTAESEKRKEVD